MSSKRRKIAAPLFVVLGGFAIAVGLVVFAPRSEAVVPERSLPTVRTEAVSGGATEAVVRATGITSPARAARSHHIAAVA